MGNLFRIRDVPQKNKEILCKAYYLPLLLNILSINISKRNMGDKIKSAKDLQQKDKIRMQAYEIKF